MVKAAGTPKLASRVVPDQIVARTASRMRSATAFGWESGTACEASTSMVVAFARLAPKRSTSGLIE
ncbi:MAG: hypothetical protein JWN52_858 [Actinomycetia bacterium]|nr:hypothetical protein [Actinomycetes bacterium]